MTVASAALAAVCSALAAESVTLVTPNRRLAAWYASQFNQAQIGSGRAVWPTPDILPWETYVERTWLKLSLLSGNPASPALLDNHQCRLLWETVVRSADFAASGLLNVRETATQALSAWTLARAWHLLPAMRRVALHEDAQMFLGWSDRFQELCRARNAIDRATVPDALADLLGDAITSASGSLQQLPASLMAAGFDIVEPQQQRLFDLLRTCGVAVDLLPAASDVFDSRCCRIEFANETDELRAAAAWARQRLESEPGANIAIVVPDLKQKRGLVMRELTDSLVPAARATAPSATGNVHPPFNVSLGVPLADYALVRDALAAIEFSLGRPMPYLQVSALLRSPFLGGGEAERAARAKLDAVLRESVAHEISLSSLRAQLGEKQAGCDRLVTLLDDVIALRPGHAVDSAVRPLPSTPPACSQHFGRVLAAYGFPGDQALDSTDYQVLAKLRDAMTSLAGLQAVQPRMRTMEALAQLRGIAGETLFQPESTATASTPIQVLGILESAGQQFDALWVSGLAEDKWPLTARPNPFIPAALQRDAGIPDASALASLELDQKITRGWLGSATEVVLSHAQVAGSGDSEQWRAASPLIRNLEPAGLDRVLMGERPVTYASLLLAAGLLERVPDVPIVALPGGTRIRGGAGVIRDQAACAFRAFARHRLGARPLSVPQPGLDAAARGTLLHRVLYLVWGSLADQATLVAIDDEKLRELIASSVTSAIAWARAQGATSLAARFAAIEHGRLCRLVWQWMIYERERGPFRVTMREAARRVRLGRLSMELRLDRMDQLLDGTHALIDYKTGVAKLASWLGERPDEPQLPLYVYASEEQISALAFARVKLGVRGKDFGFEGISAIEGLLPDVTAIETQSKWRSQGYTSWDVLTQQWESVLVDLAEDFSRGAAGVNPKNGALTCAQCDLQALCRVSEAAGHAALDVDQFAGETSSE